jgi:molecular chaperone DnaK
LGRDFDIAIPGRDKKPGELAKDFIQTLLAEYEYARGTPENIVMTIPEIWFREESNNFARKNLEKMFQDMKKYNVQLQSEPVAAAAYYCWLYQNQNRKKNPDKEPFNGHVLVIDFGGGTLDVTLCKVTDGQSIQVLERAGQGEREDTNGCAGVAFDEAVIDSLCEDGKPLDHDSREFITLRNEFEEKKILYSRNISETMAGYFIDSDALAGDDVYAINNDEWRVTCGHLGRAFDNANKSVLEKSLEDVTKRFETQHVDSNQGDTFKVLLIGGFSNFCCVQETVRRFFSSSLNITSIDLDQRFDDLLSRENRALAVAKGASLIADNKVRIEQVCTHDVGLILGRYDEDYLWEDVYDTIITAGEKLTDTASARYSNRFARVNLWGDAGPIRLYTQKGTLPPRPFEFADGVREMLKGGDLSQKYAFGVSVDGGLNVTLHVKNDDGKETNHMSLFNLGGR